MTGLLILATIIPALQEDPGTSSPLHNFLGVDAETGEFRRSGDAPATAPASGEKAVPQNAAEQASQDLERVVGRVLSEDGAGLGELLNAANGTPVGETVRVIATASFAVLLVYPLAVVLTEIVSAFGRRGEDFDKVDRRYFRRRRRLRLVVATASAAVIALLTWGQWEWFWASDPDRLVPFTITLAAAALAWATAASLVRRVDADYPAAVLRNVRNRQAELSLDLADLRRRLAKSSGAAA